MTLHDALIELNNGEVITRQAWEGKRLIFNQGGKTVKTEDMYSGKMKEWIEFFDVKETSIESHTDCLEILGETARLSCGYIFAGADLTSEDWVVAKAYVVPEGEIKELGEGELSPEELQSAIDAANEAENKELTLVKEVPNAEAGDNK